MKLLPQISQFKIGNEEYTLRIEYIWFFKNKILPRYQPIYLLIDSKGKVTPLTVKNDVNYSKLIDFIITEMKKRLISNISNLLSKLNTLWS